MAIADFQLRRDVEAELDWDTRLDSRQIGVAVKNGIVALSGYVSSYAQRRAAEEAVQHLAGVRAIANDIVVELPASGRRSDAEIADAADTALRANVSVPADRLRLVIHDGWIILSGEVALWHQRQAAETALGTLPGVKGITNNVVISANATDSDVRGHIQEAFRRRARLDAGGIVVKSADGTVTLEGAVHSWQERQQAEDAAWQTPGVRAVIDHLDVRP